MQHSSFCGILYLMRILIVEDEKQLNAALNRSFTQAHFVVDSCFDGEAALDYIAFAEYDAIILDLMLPKKNGLEVLRILRDKGNRTPTILLTARDSIEDRVRGLDAGADDYLVKPFSLDELHARVRVMIRRASEQGSDRAVISDLEIDFRSRSVSRGGEQIELTAKEFDILAYLAHNAGQLLSREKIARHVWNYDYEGNSNIIDVYIRYLRKKLDENHEPKLLHTKRGVGYVLREEP